MPEYDRIGTCQFCSGARFPLKKYRGKWLCPSCLDFKKDAAPEKVKRIGREVDEINKMIRREVS